MSRGNPAVPLPPDRYGRAVIPDGRRYRYAGPADVAGRSGPAGRPIHVTPDVDGWLAEAAPPDRAEPFTYAVDPHGTLRVAPRRSEHVACAGGGEVLAAGEITFARNAAGWTVTEVSNQSTGYCPDPSCWPAVAAALDRIGLGHPGAFTAEFLFRRCPDCATLNVVKEGDFACAACDQVLPRSWNVD